MSSLLNEICRRLNILQAHIRRTCNVDEHSVGSVDGGLHEGTRNRDSGRFLCLAFACCVSDTHMGIAGILHDAGDISKVEIDETGVLDQVRNARHCLTQHIIRDFKRICQRNLLVSGILQPIVRNDQQRVYFTKQFLDTGVRLLHTAVAFELKGLRHNADCQDSGFLCKIRHRRGSTGSGTAAHTGCDKDHVGIFQDSADGIPALFCSTSSDLGIRSGALSFGNLLTDLNFLIGIGNRECLLIGIDRNELNTLCAVLYHPVHDIVAGTADTDDFYCDDILGTSLGLKIHILCLLSESTTQYACNILSLCPL